MNLRIDGLTPQTLQSSSKSWWDEHFTRLLMDAIPLDTKQIVELDCGLAAAAHTLLPSLPDARYLGVDFNPERLSEAKKEMEGARVAPRVELRLADVAHLPPADGSIDVVLSIMSLQHRSDVPGVLEEAKRVLRPGGRLVAVEPDNLGQRFYFDGVLEEITHEMNELCRKARVARQPADIAVGPRIPELLRAASFHRIRTAAHLVHSSRVETAAAFLGRLQRIATSVVEEVGLHADEEALAECEGAINRVLFAGLPKRLGHSSHTVPVFLSIGIKP